MATNLLDKGMIAQCPHGGTVQPVPASPRVKLSGQPVLVTSDQCPVCGCPFMIVNKPQPCIGIKWLVGAQRVRASGKPVLLQQSTGQCQSAEQIPQGPPLVVQTQLRVRGT